MKKRFIGSDPGKSTAFALIEADLGVSSFFAAHNFTLLEHYLVEDCYSDQPGKRGVTASAYVTIRSILEKAASQGAAIGVEDFVGGGPRNLDSSSTLKLVGFIQGFYSSSGWRTNLQTNQKRTPYIELAREINQIVVPFSRHIVDATAHALVAAHKEWEILRKGNGAANKHA